MTPLPRLDQPCTLEQLAEHICERAPQCQHARRCADQPVGSDARCFEHTEQRTAEQLELFA